MKRRYSSIVLAAILGSMLLGGCGTGTTKTTEASYAGETISGQVSEVGENTIKMEVDDSEEETRHHQAKPRQERHRQARHRQARHRQEKLHQVKPHQVILHQVMHHQTVNLHRLRRRNRKETAVKVMVVGVGETANVILKHMERDVDNAAQPVCCVDFRSEGFGDMMGGLPVVGGVEKIPEAIQKYSVENVILADNTMPLSVRKQVRSLCEKAQVEVQDFGGYFQESRGPVTLRGLMECTKGQVELVMNGEHKCFVNGEQAMEFVTEKSVLKSVSAKDNRLVVELQKDILVPNDVKEDWVRNYEKESGEDISFF